MTLALRQVLAIKGCVALMGLPGNTLSKNFQIFVLPWRSEDFWLPFESHKTIKQIWEKPTAAYIWWQSSTDFPKIGSSAKPIPHDVNTHWTFPPWASGYSAEDLIHLSLICLQLTHQKCRLHKRCQSFMGFYFLVFQMDAGGSQVLPGKYNSQGLSYFWDQDFVNFK